METPAGMMYWEAGGRCRVNSIAYLDILAQKYEYTRVSLKKLSIRIDGNLFSNLY